MHEVWKYTFSITDGPQPRDIPVDAKTLSVLMQFDRLCLYALVDPHGSIEERTFHVMGTGHPVDPEWVYRGTVSDRQFVWHLFEVT